MSVPAIISQCPSHRVFAQHPPAETTLLPTCQACSLRLLYQYHELQDEHIRLLQLLPGSRSSPVVCSLTVVDLKHTPQYEALSYVWGDPKITEEIECDGRRVNVTVNLRGALRRFRYTDRVRLLWVDAICIDQENEIEKVKQVMMMGQIYWQAKQVTVWIGEDAEEDIRFGADAAVRLMRSCLEEYTANISIYGNADRIPRLGSDAVRAGSDERWAWEAIRRLLNRPYFKRVWVVQEVGLAREAIFHYGDASFTRDELDKFAFNYLGTRGAILAQLFCINNDQHRLMDRYARATRGSERIELGHDPKYAENFLDIMQLAKGLHCSDSRDAVYAFLSHPSAFKTKLLDVEPYMCYPDNFHVRSTLIQANYTKSYGPMELYHDLAVAALRTYDFGPKLFEYVSHTEDTITEDYPSWVPRWNLENEPTFFNPGGSYYRASGTLKHTLFSVQSSAEPNSSETSPLQLHMHASYIDVICWVFPFPSDSIFTLLPGPNIGPERAPDYPELNPLEVLSEAFSLARPLLPSPWLHDEMAFAMTAVAGLKSYEPGQWPTEEDLEANYLDWCAYRIHKSVIAGPDLDEEILKDLDQKTGEKAWDDSAEKFALDAETACRDRAFFFTEDGFIGLGPKCMKEGDECWLPKGAQMPCVFREAKGSGDGDCEDEKPRVRILGQAYVHGGMRGEAVEGLGEEIWREVIVC